MPEEVIEAEFKEQPGALAVREEPPQASIALFGTDDPVDIIGKAVRVADALKNVLVQKKLIKKIRDKDYPIVEAWQTLAVMLGITPVCEWSRPLPDGWEARVVVRSRNGMEIGAAEAQCTRSEAMWKTRDDFALRSMAQTRATAKSLRSVLGFVMVLAGYQATPAEEMPDDPPANRPPSRTEAPVSTNHENSSTAAPDKPEGPRVGQIREAFLATGRGDHEWPLFVTTHSGVKPSEKRGLNSDERTALMAAVRRLPQINADPANAKQSELGV